MHADNGVYYELLLRQPLTHAAWLADLEADE